MKLVETGKIIAVSKDKTKVRVFTETSKSQWYSFKKNEKDPNIGDKVLILRETSILGSLSEPLALGVK